MFIQFTRVKDGQSTLSAENEFREQLEFSLNLLWDYIKPRNTQEWLQWSDSLEREYQPDEIFLGLKLGAISPDYAKAYLSSIIKHDE